MAKRKRDPNRKRQPKVQLHQVIRDSNGIYHLPPDLPPEALPIPFQGELMTCALCGRQEKSAPEVEQGWRVLSHDGKSRHYFCPAEFPPDGSPSELFQLAYELAIAVMLARESDNQETIAQAQEIRRQFPW